MERSMRRKVWLAPALAVLATTIWFFFLVSSEPKPPYSEAPIEGISGRNNTGDPAELYGLWTKNSGAKLPDVFQFSPNGFCSSWSDGGDGKNFQCLGYTPFTVRGNKLYLRDMLWLGWERKGDTLVLYEFGEILGEEEKALYTKLDGAKDAEMVLNSVRDSAIETPTARPSPETPVNTLVPAPVPTLAVPKQFLPWKIYQDQEYGFRIGHPGEFFARRIDDPAEYENRGYRFKTDGQGARSFKSLKERRKNNTGIYITRRTYFPDIFFSYSELFSQLPRYANEFIFIGAYKDMSAMDLAEFTKEITCAFDSHYLMSLSYAGEVKIGKQNYSAKRYVGNACVLGKTTVKDVDVVEAFILEQGGISYFIKSHRVNWVSKTLSEILKTFELTAVVESMQSPINITYPVGGEEWRMKQQTYTIRWEPVDFTWHDGYDMSRSKGGRVILTTFAATGNVESPVGEGLYDSGEYVWTIPMGGLTHLDRPIQMLMRVFPAGVSTTTHNSYFIFSDPFTIKPLVAEYPPITFSYPVGGETIKLGSPSQISWDIPPREITKFGLLAKRTDYVEWSETNYGSVLPTKLTGDVLETIGWTPGMTSVNWDAKTIYVGLDKKTLTPGKYKIVLWFLMPDNYHTQIESNEFTITQ